MVHMLQVNTLWVKSTLSYEITCHSMSFIDGLANENHYSDLNLWLWPLFETRAYFSGVIIHSDSVKG